MEDQSMPNLTRGSSALTDIGIIVTGSTLMTSIKKTTLAGLCVLAGLGATASSASATPTTLTGTFAVTVYYGLNPSPGNGAASQVQGLPTNPLATTANELAAFTYTGALNLNAGTDNILNFLQSAGGTLGNYTFGNQTLLSSHTMSTGGNPGFTDATLIDLKFTTQSAISGTITHDDGISIYQGTTSKLDSSAPTSATPTAYGPLGVNTYDLWYAETNGLPAVLDFEVTSGSTSVPEPASLTLLGLGMIGTGMIARRRRSTTTPTAG
jgi:PEP-CTERM motif